MIATASPAVSRQKSVGNATDSVRGMRWGQSLYRLRGATIVAGGVQVTDNKQGGDVAGGLAATGLLVAQGCRCRCQATGGKVPTAGSKRIPCGLLWRRTPAHNNGFPVLSCRIATVQKITRRHPVQKHRGPIPVQPSSTTTFLFFPNLHLWSGSSSSWRRLASFAWIRPNLP